ncbi:MAG TPA: hypothetical protein VF897_22735, partial [Roseiflexaceae bacterium]
MNSQQALEHIAQFRALFADHPFWTFLAIAIAWSLAARLLRRDPQRVEAARTTEPEPGSALGTGARAGPGPGSSAGAGAGADADSGSGSSADPSTDAGVSVESG